jgi:hypothetical protein
MQYKVFANKKVTYSLVVTADNPDDAYFKAEDTERDLWEIVGEGEWEIEAVEHGDNSDEIIDAEIVEE